MDAHNRINSRLQENDAAPFIYNRELVAIPGCPIPLTMPDMITEQSCEIVRQHFIPRDDDVWLATYPKSGTTWVQVLQLLIFTISSILHHCRKCYLFYCMEMRILGMEVMKELALD